MKSSCLFGRSVALRSVAASLALGLFAATALATDGLTSSTTTLQEAMRASEKEALARVHGAELATIPVIPGAADERVLGNVNNLCFPPGTGDGSTLSMGPNDDGSSGVINLGFTFNLYGTD